MLDVAFRSLTFVAGTFCFLMIFLWVRRHVAIWPWGERKGVLWLLTFSVLPILSMRSALKDDVPTGILDSMLLTVMGMVIVCFFAILAAPEPGSQVKNKTLKGMLRIAATSTIFVTMSISALIALDRFIGRP